MSQHKDISAEVWRVVAFARWGWLCAGCDFRQRGGVAFGIALKSRFRYHRRMMNSIVGQPVFAMGAFGTWELVVIACLIGLPLMFVVGVAWLVAKLIKKSSPSSPPARTQEQTPED